MKGDFFLNGSGNGDAFDKKNNSPGRWINDSPDY
jgi:hypothetical protein